MLQQCLIFSCFTFVHANKSNFIILSVIRSEQCWFWSDAVKSIAVIHCSTFIAFCSTNHLLCTPCLCFFMHIRCNNYCFEKKKKKPFDKKTLFLQFTLSLVSGYQDGCNQQPAVNHPLEHGTAVFQNPISGEGINYFVFAWFANGDYLTTHMFNSYQQAYCFYTSVFIGWRLLNLTMTHPHPCSLLLTFIADLIVVWLH